MAIPKTFTAGERLFAADLNGNFEDLDTRVDAADAQGVRVFADAAARTTAIPTPAEGMLTYNEDTEQLEVFDGSAFVPAGAEPPAGIGSNVVSVIKGDVFTTSSSSFVDVTGLTVTITPTTATSKILVIVSVTGKSSDVGNAGNAGFVLVRDSTQIAVGTGAAVSQFTGQLSGRSLAADDMSLNSAAGVIDSPNTSSAVVYKVQVKTAGGTIVINQDNALQSSSVSTITAIEVAA